MHAARLLVFLTQCLLVAGCTGLNSSSRPTPEPVTDAPSTEFVYVGSNSGTFGFIVSPPTNALLAATTSHEMQALCSPQFRLVPGHVFSVSDSCSAGDVEVRRFDLVHGGEISGSSGPIPLPDHLPANPGSPVLLFPNADNDLLYAWTIGSDFQEHITPVQIDAQGNLTTSAGPGISFPLQDTASSECGEAHTPISSFRTSAGMFLVVQDWRVCKGADGPEVLYSIFDVDGRSGGIGSVTGGFGNTYPAFPVTAFNGDLAVLGNFAGNQDPASGLELRQIGPNGAMLLQRCTVEAAFCKHAELVSFHPAGHWLFVFDRSLQGIWSVPVEAHSLSFDKSVFSPVDLHGGGWLVAFSADGRALYLGQSDSATRSSSLQSFAIDQASGSLTPIPGSQWTFAGTSALTSMIDVGGKQP